MGATPDGTQTEGGLRVVYCGGCNPAIDRVAVAEQVSSAAGEQPAALYVSGCQRACASGHRLTAAADEAAVVIAGEHVEAVPTAATDIVEAVVRKIGPPAEGARLSDAGTRKSSAGE